MTNNTTIPYNFNLLSSNNAKNAINDFNLEDFGNNSHARKVREKSKTGMIEAALEMIKAAKTDELPIDYVLADSWFAVPKFYFNAKNAGVNVITMLKNTTKIHYLFTNKYVPLQESNDAAT